MQRKTSKQLKSKREFQNLPMLEFYLLKWLGKIINIMRIWIFSVALCLFSDVYFEKKKTFWKKHMNWKIIKRNKQLFLSSQHLLNGVEKQNVNHTCSRKFSVSTEIIFQ